MYKAKVKDKEFEIEFNSDNYENGTISNIPFEIDILKKNSNSFHVIKNKKSYNVNVLSIDNDTKKVKLKINNYTYEVEVKDELDELLNKMGIKNKKQQTNKDLKAPMPGLVTNILVNIGDEIKKGDNLLVLEAMKMENNLKAENDAIIKDIIVEKGNSVEKKQVLIIFE